MNKKSLVVKGASDSTTILMWLLLLVFPPVGIYLLWKDDNFELMTKKILAFSFSALFLCVLLFMPGLNIYGRIMNIPDSASPNIPVKNKLIFSKLIDIKELAGKSEKNVTSILGKPQSIEPGTFHLKGSSSVIENCPLYSYSDGEIQIKFVEGQVARVFLKPKRLIASANYAKALGMIGLDTETKPSFQNNNVVKWNNVEGIYEVSAFNEGIYMTTVQISVNERYK